MSDLYDAGHPVDTDDTVRITMPVTEDLLSMYGGHRMTDAGQPVYEPPPIELPVERLGFGVVDLGQWVIESIERRHRYGHPITWYATFRRIDPQ